MADTKQEGAKKNCFTCKKEMVCVNVPGGTKQDGTKWPDRLVWQTGGVAHYGYNAGLGKPFCKSSEGGEQPTRVASGTPTDQLNISGLTLDKKQQESIMGAAEDRVERMLVVLSTVQRKCREAGIEHPATIGMIFNQVCEIGRE
jgi:hypothetical protein